MTKTDFEALAAALADAGTKAKNYQERRGVALAASMIAQACSDSNPRFDVERFMEACLPQNVSVL